MNEARPRLAAAVKVVDGALAGRDYLLGTEFSTADVMVGSTLAWAAMLGAVSPEFANVAGYVARLGARPAYQRAAAD